MNNVSAVLNASDQRKITVKIHYGIFGGERLGGRLRRELSRQGYEVTRRQADADIVIAHSAGCFWLHDVRPDQRLMLIGPPYWPEKNMSERARRRTRQNFHFKQSGYSLRRWLAKNLWGGYYAVRDARRTLRIINHGSRFDLTTIIQQRHHVLLIRNQHDPWLTDNLKPLQQLNPALIIRQLPGDHEDWYFHPQRYVNLLSEVFGRPQIKP